MSKNDEQNKETVEDRIKFEALTRGISALVEKALDQGIHISLIIEPTKKRDSD